MLGSAFLFTSSCTSEGDVDGSLFSYGGSDPKGDFIVIIMDKENSLVKHTNYTEGEIESSQPWYAYTSVDPSNAYANGFSIIYRVDLGVDGFVLFSEFPQAAVVYQKFDSLGDADGDPVYAVYREQVDKTSYYNRAYNWLRFFIDTSVAADQSDMSAGFTAFDAASTQGSMYGAGYSKKEDVENPGDPDGGVDDINEGDTVTVDGFTADSATVSNIMWTGAIGDWAKAIAMVGTASGSVILDFGSDMGGGMGLAIPQASISWSAVAGTYFTMVYEFNQLTDESQVNPMKIVITSSGYCEVYPFDLKTDNPANAVFNRQFVALGSLLGGPLYPTETIAETFERVSGVDQPGVVSSVVQNAYTCNGTFVAEDPAEDQVVVAVCDSSGRFFGFTMFDEELSTDDYIIRFGCGIRDTGYTNSY
jgi:hypothetical protein